MIEMTGLVSLGQAAIVAAGAYGTIGLMTHLGLPIGVCLVGGAVLSAVVGLVLAIPGVRIKGAYFAILTIILGGSVPDVVNLFSGVTGGQNGLYVASGPFVGVTATYSLYWLSLALLLVALFLCYNTQHSAIGAALRTAKYHRVAAAVEGVSVRKHQILAVTMGNLFAGVGGGLLALHTGGVSADSFGLSQSTYYLIGAVVGGTSTVFGGVLGGVFVEGLIQALTSASVYSDLILGSLLLLSLVALPDGFAGAAQSAWSAMVERLRRIVGGSRDDDAPFIVDRRTVQR